jgi:hypothetical protein
MWVVSAVLTRLLLPHKYVAEIFAKYSRINISSEEIKTLHFSSFLGWSGTESASTITEATSGLLYSPGCWWMDDKCGAAGGMLGRGNRNTRRTPAPVLLCSPQIPHDLNRARTRAAAVGSWRLTAWASALPKLCIVTDFVAVIILRFFLQYFAVNELHVRFSSVSLSL